MKYYIIPTLWDYQNPIGPFNTIYRAQAYKKKYHIFGYITERI